MPADYGGDRGSPARERLPASAAHANSERRRTSRTGENRMRKWLPLVTVCLGHVHAADRRHDRERRAARHGDRPEDVLRVAAVGGRRLRAGAGRAGAGDGLDRRPRRPPAGLRRRARPVRRGVARLRHRAELRACSSPPAPCRASAPPAMFATTFALLNSSYSGRDRGTAYGLWGAVAGASAAVGPIIGGLLTEGRVLAVDLLREPAGQRAGHRAVPARAHRRARHDQGRGWTSPASSPSARPPAR